MSHMSDPQKQRLYCLETIFWAKWNRHAEGMCTVMDQQEWEEYCEWLLADGLENPYRGQRRRSRTKSLTFVPMDPTSTANAVAYQRTDTLGCKPEYRTKFIAMHEVAHLLTRELRQNSHGWQFVSVYAQMIGRHISERAAREFRGLAHAQSVQFTQYLDQVRFVA